MAIRAVFLLSLPFTVACAEDVAPQTSAPGEDSPPGLVIDFGLEGESSWYSVNDTVMGGVSEGSVDYTQDSIVFEGVVSTESNGGFTSIRSPNGQWDLSPFSRMVVRMKSEGQSFSMIVADSPYFWEGQFRYDIEADAQTWSDVEIPLIDFEFHEFEGGYPEPTGEEMESEAREDVHHMEFMSELFQDGAFRLEVDHISFW